VKRIDSQTVSAVTKTLNEIFTAYPNVQRTFKTITSDNGSEFSELSEQGKEWKIDVYFAHPYASRERGSNERHNGLIRRFIKKGQPIHRYSDEQIDRVAEWMNTLPRKILDYLIPEKPYIVVSPRALHLLLQFKY